MKLLEYLEIVADDLMCNLYSSCDNLTWLYPSKVSRFYLEAACVLTVMLKRFQSHVLARANVDVTLHPYFRPIETTISRTKGIMIF